MSLLRKVREPDDMDASRSARHRILAGPGGHAERLLALQSMAGNRAVIAALWPRGVQRQPSTAGASGDGARAGGAGTAAHGATGLDAQDAELQALLAQISGSMPSPERVAPYEVLSATTAAEYSTGELDTAVERLWRRERLDFTAAARRAVATPAADGRATGTEGPRLQAGRVYALRRAVTLLAADYQGNSDLPQVAAIARRGSPYQRALTAEFGRQRPVRNPTAAKIKSEIFNAIIGMWRDLGPTQVGELVVTFSGHGGGGYISGVDWKRVGIDWLQSMANLAADHHVHVVYVIDTCRAGMMVNWAQKAALEDVEARIGALPKDRQAPLRERFHFVRELARTATQVGVDAHAVGDAARAEVRRRTSSNRLAYFQALVSLTNSRLQMRGLVTGADVPDGIPQLTRVVEAQERLGVNAITAMAGSGREVGPALRAAALLLDAANDVINAALVAIDRDTQSGRAASEGGQDVGAGTSA